MSVDIVYLDRTLKGIAVVDAAPVYESLPGFERYVPPHSNGEGDEDGSNYTWGRTY